MTVEKQKEELIMKSTYETMGGKYRQDGDYLLPNFEVPECPKVGVWGEHRRKYLREHPCHHPKVRYAYRSRSHRYPNGHQTTVRKHRNGYTSLTVLYLFIVGIPRPQYRAFPENASR